MLHLFTPVPQIRGNPKTGLAHESSDEQINVVTREVISIDFGLNNLATVISSTDESFIIDGRWLKSKNQWFNKRRAKLQSLCERYGLNYVEQEESYTSRASSLDRDEIPVYNADNPVNPKFSGRRIKRGLYKTHSGHLINADANGSLGIGLKSKHKLSFERVSRVCLTQPVRINVLQESLATSERN